MSSDADFYGCYFPDHTKAYNQTKCVANAQESWCCYIADTCLDNGLCFQSSGIYSNRIGRGACSDSTWSSPACPKYCADLSPSMNTEISVAFDRPNGAYCCGSGFNLTTNLCPVSTAGSFAPFDIPVGNVIYNRTNGASIKNGILTLLDQDAVANSSSSSSSSTSTSSSSTLTSTSTADTSAPTSPSMTGSLSSSDQTSESCRVSSTNATALAAGIAVPLGVLLIAALLACALLYRQNRRLHREAQIAKAEPADSTDDGVTQSMASPPQFYYQQEAKSSPDRWSPTFAHSHFAPQQSDHAHPEHNNAREPEPQEVDAKHVTELPTVKSHGPQ